MSERLTDRDLKRLDVPGIGDDVRMMAREIMERRALDLNETEQTGLRWIEKFVASSMSNIKAQSQRAGVIAITGLTALSKFIGKDRA